MRDYQQRKEIQELRKQQEAEEAANVAEETAPEEENGSENEKYAHRGPGFRGWISYVWEYYKWPILIIGVILIGVLVGLRQAFSNANPDLSVTYVGPFYLSADNQKELREEFARLSGDQNGDFNGDGEYKCSLLDLTITYVQDADKNVYTYDEQNGAYTRFQTELRAGDTLLYFLDRRYYEEAKGEGVLQKLADVLDDASLSFDGYGLYLGDLPCYGSPGFSRMPAGTVVCLRQSPSEDAIRYGRTTDSWLAHVEILKAMVSDGAGDSSGEELPDVTILYVSSEPAFRSHLEGMRLTASGSVPDRNGDGKTVLGLTSVCISGTKNDPRRAIAEKQAKTEIVTGETFVWILSPEMFRYAADRGLLSPLPEDLSAGKASVEGYGLLLSELPLGGTAGFADLRQDSILCLRRSPISETESYGRTEAAYQAAETVFRALAAATPVEK